MKRKITVTCFAIAVCFSVSQAQKNVVLYIGDGFGMAAKTATRMALGQGTDGKRFSTDPQHKVLQLDNLRYNAMVTTHSLNSWITDSAPGACVYASGKKGKVDNEVIGLDPNNSFLPVETILEFAKKQGYAVGIVTTTRVTHATPAAFASHVWYRDLENHIATQFLCTNQTVSGVGTMSGMPDYQYVFNSSTVPGVQYDANRDWQLPSTKIGVEVDVILGGGARHFLPKSAQSINANVVDATGTAIINQTTGSVITFSGKRADNVDLIEFAKTQKNYKYVNSRDALLNLDINMFTGTGMGSKKLLGLFNTDHVNYELDRQTNANWEPALSEMVDIAIKVLKKKGGANGFFLIVESGRIDHLAHANAGGITIVTGPAVGTASGANMYTVDSDKPAYVGGGDANYSATPSTARSNFYGSDYVINEVLAFDYAVGKGRELLTATGSTLILSTSDHECGGMAVVGLHDELDDQKNGTLIRTYAQQITTSSLSTGVNVSDKGVVVSPVNLTRGDGGKQGWFPQYMMIDVQGKMYPRPASATAKRIVISYGSNPNTNGNSQKAGGTPGNHTPQDIWVGADDNTGVDAKNIIGKGLLDNTYLTNVMAKFFGFSAFGPFSEY
jgi:alkaline phosphatase